MNGLRNFLLLGGIALSLALPQLATAEDIKIDETKSHDRNVQWTDINPNVQAPVLVPAQVKKTEVNKAVSKITQPKKTQPLASAHHGSAPKKKQDPVPTKTAVKPPAEHKSRPANESQVQLVSMQQNDGPVFTAKLDRDGNQPKYKVGDKLVVNVTAHQDCNVVVFNYDSTGTLTQIFPNDFQQNGFVRAGDSVEIGGADSNFDYQISGKGGPEKIFVYAYPTGKDNPISTLTAMAPIAGTPFRGTSGMTVDKYRELVNGSQVFFSRSVQVMPKRGNKLVSAAAPAASPNKLELGFTVEK